MEARVIEAKKEKLRVLMSPTEQKQFIRTIKTKCNLTWNELGRICGVKGETVKIKYYLRGFTLPLKSALAMANILSIPLPPHKLLPANWGQVKGGLKKLPWDPPPYSKKLAELLGILIGDGCLCKFYDKKNRKYGYHVGIDGHSHERSYYETVIRPLFEKLFGVHGYIYCRSDQNALVFFTRSKRIYEFLKSIGMPEGVKNKSEKFVIPRWVIANPEFIRACIRGLTDTDGTVFKSHGRWVNIQYKFASKSLTKSLHSALMKIGYHPTKVKKKSQFNPESGKTNTCWQFYLSRRNEVDKFASEIGFNNTWLKEKYQNGSKLENASYKKASEALLKVFNA